MVDSSGDAVTGPRSCSCLGFLSAEGLEKGRSHARLLCSPPGKTCQQADPCASNPCANGGQCVPFEAHYICKCTAGFHGANCKQDVNECSLSTPVCKNGGICTNEVGTYQCSCKPAYTGQNCELLYVPCNPSPCQNGGTCRQTGDTTYDCTCLPGTCLLARMGHGSPALGWAVPCH